jgi:hypothetical protein
MSTQSQLSKVFAFDEMLLGHKLYQRSFRFMLRRASAPVSDEQTPRSVSPTSMSALELRDSYERSARLDSMLKAEARKKTSELSVISLGHKRSTIAKQLRSQLGPLFQEDETHDYRRLIVENLIKVLLDIVEDVETWGAGFATDQARRFIKLLRDFAESASPEWNVSPEVSAAARGLWRNWLVQQSFQQSARSDCLTA